MYNHQRASMTACNIELYENQTMFSWSAFSSLFSSIYIFYNSEWFLARAEGTFLTWSRLLDNVFVNYFFELFMIVCVSISNQGADFTLAMCGRMSPLVFLTSQLAVLYLPILLVYYTNRFSSIRQNDFTKACWMPACERDLHSLKKTRLVSHTNALENGRFWL